MAVLSIHTWSATVWSNTGGTSASTSTLKLSVALSPSSSLTVHSMMVSAAEAEGVPEIVRVATSKLKPDGKAGSSPKTSAPLPPVASGSTTSAIASPSSHTWSATVALPNEGARSSLTSTSKLSVVVSPSASVAVQLMVSLAVGAEGVPEIVRVAVSRASPEGSDGLNA